MSWTFRETKNKHLLSKAFDWYLRMPGFIRNACGYDENDRELFVSNMLGGRTFVGHLDGRAVAVVLSERRGIMLQEGHLYCEKGVPKPFITALVAHALSQLNEPVLLEIASRQRSLQTVVEKAGFHFTGLHKWKGVYRGKPYETQFYISH